MRDSIGVFLLRSRLAIEQFLSGQAHDLAAVRVDHQRIMKEKATPVAIPRRAQPLDRTAMNAEIGLRRIADQQDGSLR